jgi:TPR repeat protein
MIVRGAESNMEPIKIKKWLVLVALISLGFASVASVNDSGKSRTALMMETLSVQREKALSGSVKDAEEIVARLANDLKNGDLDQKVFNFWIRIAAENGSASARHAYAQRLWTRGSPLSNSRKRAIYWASQSKRTGFSPAERLLEMWRLRYPDEFTIH